MQFGPVKIFFICLGLAAVLYFLYYFVIPIFISGFWLNRHYAKSKYEDGFFWVKLKKTDIDYWPYKIDMTGVHLKDVCWFIYDQHKRAYKIYLSGREDDKPSN